MTETTKATEPAVTAAAADRPAAVELKNVTKIYGGARPGNPWRSLP